jgi:hypothetical protein
MTARYCTSGLNDVPAFARKPILIVVTNGRDPDSRNERTFAICFVILLSAFLANL